MKGGKQFHQRSWLLLLIDMEVKVLVEAARGCVLGSRYQLGHGWCTVI